MKGYTECMEQHQEFMYSQMIKSTYAWLWHEIIVENLLVANESTINMKFLFYYTICPANSTGFLAGKTTIS